MEATNQEQYLAGDVLILPFESQDTSIVRTPTPDHFEIIQGRYEYLKGYLKANPDAADYLDRWRELSDLYDQIADYLIQQAQTIALASGNKK